MLRDELITNSPHFIRGHDPRTGRELWRIEDPKGEVKVVTPVVAGDLAIVTGGYPLGGRPIYAVGPGGKVVWRNENGSPYTPTPVVYDGVLYVVRAGKTFELLARNAMGEMCMATPAISGDLLLVRTRSTLYAIGSASDVAH